MAASAELRRRVGARIRAARDAKSWSQRELAQAIPGAAESTYVSRWERGEVMPSWGNLEAIAAALGVELWWLLGAPTGGPRRR